jgi:hypothetical protein
LTHRRRIIPGSDIGFQLQEKTMNVPISRSALAALFAAAVFSLPALDALAQYAEPYDPLKAGEDAYSYAETRRRYDIRRQIEWNDESRARLGIPPKFDNTVSYVPLTVATGYSDSYPLFPDYGPGHGYGNGGYGNGGYGNGGFGGGLPPGYGGAANYGLGTGAAFCGVQSAFGNSQANGPYGYGAGYRTYGNNAPYPVTTPYPNAPVSRYSRWNNLARRVVGLPPKAHNDRAYLSMFPYYNPTPQPIGSITQQSGPDSYQTLPVYAKPKTAAEGASAAPPVTGGREF